MARPKSVKTLRKDIIENLYDVYINSDVTKELLGFDLDEYVNKLDVANESDCEAAFQEIVDKVEDAFLSKQGSLETVKVNYEDLLRVREAVGEEVPYSFVVGGHTISGEGGDEYSFFETDIEVDGKSIVAELTSEKSIDIKLQVSSGMIEYASMYGFDFDDVASYFGATIRLEFEGVENYAIYY